MSMLISGRDQCSTLVVGLSPAAAAGAGWAAWTWRDMCWRAWAMVAHSAAVTKLQPGALQGIGSGTGGAILQGTSEIIKPGLLREQMQELAIGT